MTYITEPVTVTVYVDAATPDKAQHTLATQLRALHPVHRVADQHSQRLLALAYDLTYRVTPLSTSDQARIRAELEAAIASAQPTDDPGPADYARVPVERVSRVLQTLGLHGGASPAVLLISPLPDSKPYCYTSVDTVSGTTWVTDTGLAVVDGTAGVPGGCVAGSALHHGRDTAFTESHGTLDADRAPRWTARGHAALLPGMMARDVISALEHVLLPDVVNSHAATHPGALVYVPLIVFRDHTAYDPLDRVSVETVQTQLQRLLLPGQRAVVAAGVHDLVDHREVALALRRAMRTDTAVVAGRSGVYTRHEQTVLDPALLAEYLGMSGDVLAQGLIDHSPLHGLLYGESDVVASSRVVPVFVFSLRHAPAQLVMDVPAQQVHGARVAATEDAVMVLDSDAEAIPVPFHADGLGWTVDGAPSMPGIVSALASVVANVAPVHRRCSQVARRHMIGGVDDALLHGNTATASADPDCRMRVSYAWVLGASGSVFGTSGVVTEWTSKWVVARAAVASTVDQGVRLYREKVHDIDAFARRLMYNPSYDDVRHSYDRMPQHRLWIDRLVHWRYSEETTASLVAHNTVRRLHDALLLADESLRGVETTLHDAHAAYGESGDDDAVLAALHEAHVQAQAFLDGARAFGPMAEAAMHSADVDLQCCAFSQKQGFADMQSLSVGVVAVVCILFLMLDRVLGAQRARTTR